MRFEAHERAHSRTEREIAEEKASALVRISRRLELEVAALADAFDALAGETDSERRRALVRVARERRATAERWRWYLMVQREALGLRDPRTADELLPLPSPPGR